MLWSLFGLFHGLVPLLLPTGFVGKAKQEISHSSYCHHKEMVGGVTTSLRLHYWTKWTLCSQRRPPRPHRLLRYQSEIAGGKWLSGSICHVIQISKSPKIRCNETTEISPWSRLEAATPTHKQKTEWSQEQKISLRPLFLTCINYSIALPSCFPNIPKEIVAS